MNAFLFIWLALAAGFAVVKAFTGLRRAIRIANHKEVMPLFSSSLREIEASRVVMNDRLLSEWDCPVSPIKRLILIWLVRFPLAVLFSLPTSALLMLVPSGLVYVVLRMATDGL